MAAEKIDGLTMKQWLSRVDAIVNKRCGVSVHDLADFCIWDCWHDGMTPADGAIEALENDGLGTGLFPRLPYTYRENS